MKADQLFGLVKFYRGEHHLDDLIGGKVYLNTPEFYRLTRQEGVGDPESVTLAYRRSRGDPEPELLIDGRPIHDVTSFTFRVGGGRDRWMHCCTALHFPGDEKTFVQMVENLRRMRTEFGLNYAFIHVREVSAFLERLRALTPDRIDAVRVAYSDDRSLWSPSCKGTAYLYQREVRFLVGECDEHSKPLVLADPKGFAGLVHKNVDLAFQHRIDETTLFRLHGAELTVNWPAANADFTRR